jgi:hypothetical protein
MNCERKVRKWWSLGFKVRCGGAKIYPTLCSAVSYCGRCGKLDVAPKFVKVATARELLRRGIRCSGGPQC